MMALLMSFIFLPINENTAKNLIKMPYKWDMEETLYLATPYAIAQFADAVVSVIVSVLVYRRRESRSDYLARGDK
jgi:hypothetical protein